MASDGLRGVSLVALVCVLGFGVSNASSPWNDNAEAEALGREFQQHLLENRPFPEETLHQANAWDFMTSYGPGLSATGDGGWWVVVPARTGAKSAQTARRRGTPAILRRGYRLKRAR